MKKRNLLVLALMMGVCAGTVGATTIDSEAKTIFTVAQDASQVTYGKLTAEERAIIEELFDADFYAATNYDVVSTLGSDYDTLINHFCDCGIWEGRKGWPDFDPAAYSSAYPELRQTYGNNIPAYYIHFYNVGRGEKMYLTTVEKCEELGIEVIPFFDFTLLDVNIYQAANWLGVDDYHEVSGAASVAASSGAAAIDTGNGTAVFATTDAATLIAKCKGFTEVGTITLNGQPLVIYITSTSTGYNAYTSDANNGSITANRDEDGNLLSVDINLPDDIQLVYSTDGNTSEVGNYAQTLTIRAVDFSEELNNGNIRSISEYDEHGDGFPQEIVDGGIAVATNPLCPTGIGAYTFGNRAADVESTDIAGNFHANSSGVELTPNESSTSCYHYSYDDQATESTEFTCVMNIDGDDVSIGAYNEADAYAIITTYPNEL